MSASKIIAEGNTKKASIGLIYNQINGGSYYLITISEAKGFKYGTSCAVQVTEAFAKQLSEREGIVIKTVEHMGHYNLDLYSTTSQLK